MKANGKKIPILIILLCILAVVGIVAVRMKAPPAPAGMEEKGRNAALSQEPAAALPGQNEAAASEPAARTAPDQEAVRDGQTGGRQEGASPAQTERKETGTSASPDAGETLLPEIVVPDLPDVSSQPSEGKSDMQPAQEETEEENPLPDPQADATPLPQETAVQGQGSGSGAIELPEAP